MAIARLDAPPFQTKPLDDTGQWTRPWLLWFSAVGSIAGRLILGEETPEGSVKAEVGTLYLRRDGGAGTTLYVKQSGSDVTGWVAK